MDGSNPTTGAVNTNGTAPGGGTCIMNCSNDSEPYSFHTDMINVVMGDGRVIALRRNMNPAAFAALCTAYLQDMPGDY